MNNCIPTTDHLFIVFGAIILTALVVSLLAGVINLTIQKDKLEAQIKKSKSE
jgi:hypothetical protein